MKEEKKTPTFEPISTVDPWEYIQVTLYPDGTITCHFHAPAAPPSANPSATTVAHSKDLPIGHHKGTWARLFLPKFALNNPENYNKLPLVVYYHGGGFVVFHAYSKLCHDFCELLAETTAVLVVFVEYRLAPEHCLLAAYDDATDALTWINDSLAHPNNENWISRYGDSSNCFMMGSSAGGNIAYHAGLRVSGLHLDPLRIRGLIPHTPFFGGVDRGGSEKRLADDPHLPVAGTDLMRELALPRVPIEITITQTR